MARPDEKHNASAYVNRKCRCEICRRANADAQRRRMLTREQREPPRHDDGIYHNWRCRCPICTAAHARHERAAIAKRVAKAKELL